MNLNQVAIVRRINLYRRSLWHGLAWRWHSKNDTSRNGRGHGQYFDAKHDKILLFSLRTRTPWPYRRMTGYKAFWPKPTFGGKDRSEDNFTRPHNTADPAKRCEVHQWER
jgi:hypothetical protein